MSFPDSHDCSLGSLPSKPSARGHVQLRLTKKLVLIHSSMEIFAHVALEEDVDWTELPLEVLCNEIVEKHLGPLDVYCLALTSHKWFEICDEIKDLMMRTKSESFASNTLQGKGFFQQCILTGRLSCVEWGARFVNREACYGALRYAIIAREPSILNYLLDEGFPVEDARLLTLLSAHHGSTEALQIIIDRGLIGIEDISVQIINIARNGDHGDFLEYAYHGPLRHLFREHVFIHFNINLALAAKTNKSLKTLLHIFHDQGNIIPATLLDDALKYGNAGAVDILATYLSITFKFAKRAIMKGDKAFVKATLDSMLPTELQVMSLYKIAILENRPEAIDYLCEFGYGNPILAEELVFLALTNYYRSAAICDALKRNHFPFPSDAEKYPKMSDFSPVMYDAQRMRMSLR